MNTEDFFALIKNKLFDEAHSYIDNELDREDIQNLHHLNQRRATVLIAEKRYDEALKHLILNRTRCGSITYTHETIAMIYEITGKDDLALTELDSAPFDEEENIYPLFVSDTRFYRLFFRAKRKLLVTKQEIDAFPPDYETYLPANGHMRGILVRKDDLLSMTQLG